MLDVNHYCDANTLCQRVTLTVDTLRLRILYEWMLPRLKSAGSISDMVHATHCGVFKMISASLSNIRVEVLFMPHPM